MTTRPKTARATPAKVPPLADLPVTRAMLYGVRDELAARIDQTNARLDVLAERVEQLDGRIDQTNARIDQTNARIDQTNSELRSFKAEMRHEFEGFRAEMRAATARLQTIVEDQESRNRVVLESVQGHNARFDRIEAEIVELKGLVHELIRSLAKRP